MNYKNKVRMVPFFLAAAVLMGAATDFDMNAEGGAENTAREQNIAKDSDTGVYSLAAMTGAADSEAAEAYGRKSDFGSAEQAEEPNEGQAEDLVAGETTMVFGMGSDAEEPVDVLTEDKHQEESELFGAEDTYADAGDFAELNSESNVLFEEEAEESLPDHETVADSETEDEEEVDDGPAPKFYNVGVRHSSVADIQQRLMDLGFMDYSEPTTYYGSITSQAVKLFQRQNDLKEDGIIGPDTLELLFSDDAKTYLAKLGMKGDDIKRIQVRLYEMGYLAKEEQITGYFGDVTEKAVKQFQNNNGLLADGKVGTMTMEMFYDENAKANLLAYGSKSEVVLACQERLKELGYLTTTPDGAYGSDTVAAVKQFQTRNDLVADGFLGPSTMVVLHQSDAVPNGLMLGDSGDSVKSVQKLLAKYGYLSSNNTTGYFGELTEAAVKAFQKKNGLVADGNVGKLTMAKLTGQSAVKATGESTGSSSSSGNSSGTSSNSGNTSINTVASSNESGVAGLLKAAKSKVGSKYVYGSKGPNTFDCSGYVYWCLKQVGVKQNYITSYGWRTVGKYQKITKFSDIKAGDIVVVYGHVGIAAGNGMVYDASSSEGKIVYRSLGAWWKKNFIVAWRIF